MNDKQRALVNAEKYRIALEERDEAEAEVARLRAEIFDTLNIECPQLAAAARKAKSENARLRALLREIVGDHCEAHAEPQPETCAYCEALATLGGDDGE